MTSSDEALTKLLASRASQLGFKLSDGAGYLRLAHDQVILEARYTPETWEVDIRLWRAGDAYSEHAPYSTSELRELVLNVLDAEPPQVSSARRYKWLVREAEAALEMVSGALSRFGAGDFFEGLRVIRRVRGLRYETRTRLAVARTAASEAWREQSYSEVVEALSGITEYLTPAETRKLAFALRRAVEE